MPTITYKLTSLRTAWPLNQQSLSDDHFRTEEWCPAAARSSPLLWKHAQALHCDEGSGPVVGRVTMEVKQFD